MNPPQSAIENSLVSATQAAHDPVYREALWISVVFTGMVIAAALLEWLKSGHPIVLGELLVLMETSAIYARAALASRLSRRDDTLMEFLTGIILAPLAILAVLSSLSLLITPEELKPSDFLKLFSLVVAIEFLSEFVLLEERPSTVSLSELFGPRIFAWFAHCALLVTGMYPVLAPNASIDAALGLCVATLCMLMGAHQLERPS